MENLEEKLCGFVRSVVSFKAGRAFRREGTNFVDPKPEKGLLTVFGGEDGLLHWQWKNRTTNNLDDDLIIFPSEATFSQVKQSESGRTYVLKFSSSNQRHFYWLQDAYTGRDRDYVTNLNGLLEDPSYPVTWTAPPAASSSSVPYNLGDLTDLPSMISELRAQAQAQAQHGPDLFLSDVLTPANVAPLFAPQNAHILETLFPHLPPDLPTNPDADSVRRIIESPQFQASVRQLDQALSTGLLAGLVISLGLPAAAGTGVGPFLQAIREKAAREERPRGENSEDSMETD